MADYGRAELIYPHILTKKDDSVDFHQNIELFFILQGNMDIQVGNRKSHLTTLDLLAVNANEQYTFHASDDILFLRLTIPCQLINTTMESADCIIWCDSSRKENSHYDLLRASLKQLLIRYLGVKSRGNDFGYYSICYHTMDILTAHFLLHVSDQEGASDKEQYADRIVQINNYIHSNYNFQISLKDLAQKLYLSQGYLSRFFRKNYNMTFAEYLTKIRLYHAADALAFSKKTVTQIANDCGFSNIISFDRAFREQYGKTPTELRKELRNEREADSRNETESLTDKRLELFLRSDGKPDQHTSEVLNVGAHCDTTHRLPLQNMWGEIINIGSASDLLKYEVRDHLVLLSRSLKFKYVRFWNIFSEDMLIDLNLSNGKYNFSKLDSILDFLVDNGLKPHIELGMKPRRIYRTVQSAIIEEKAQQPFQCMEQWCSFLRVMMSHLLRRYRKVELNTWRIELWFDESQWGDENAEQRYYEIFNAAYTIIKQFADGLEIGGCGCRTIDMSVSGMRFFSAWSKQPCLPDFISQICFAYEVDEIRGDRYSKRSTDEEILIHMVQEMRQVLSHIGFDKVKLYVTEWNLTVSDRNYINDSCYKGAYIVKNVISLYGEADKLAYFMGSDLTSEHYDSGVFLCGGSGLISKDGILKSAGYAFKFFSWLFPLFISKGEHYLLTTDGYDAYGLVVHNQRPLNYNYYLSREDLIEKERIWNYYEDLKKLNLTLYLDGVTNGRYQIKTHRIAEHIGDALSVWGEMEFETELTREDIKYLGRACGPKLSIQTVEARNNTLKLVMDIEPNEIRFVRIRKL